MKKKLLTLGVWFTIFSGAGLAMQSAISGNPFLEIDFPDIHYNPTEIRHNKLSSEKNKFYEGKKSAFLIDGQQRGSVMSLANDHDITIPYAPIEILMAGAHTIELWVKLSEPATDGSKTILSNHGRVNNNTTGFTLEVNTNSTVSAVYGNNSGGWTTVNSREALAIGEWNHIAVTANPGESLKFYLNGELKGTSNFGSYTANNTWDFAFGSSQNYGGQYNFEMDEFRMWSVVKTQEEIQGDLHTSVANSDIGENLQLYYKFDQEDTGTLVNSGVNQTEVSYINASFVPATSPVAEFTEDFDDVVAASWSFQNETSNGISVVSEIGDFNQNIVFGRSQNNSVEEIPGAAIETLYVAGGWNLNPLNISETDLKVELSHVLDDVNIIDAIVLKYLLIQGDPQGTYQEVAEAATSVDGIVTFNNVELTSGNYYLAFEVDEDAAIQEQGGVLDMSIGDHQVYVPREGVSQALSQEFTIELWGRLNTTAGSNTKLVGFTSFDGGNFGWELEFLGNQTLQTITGRGSAGGWNTISSTYVWRTGEWNHVAVTFVPNGDFKFYINGELAGSIAVGNFTPGAYDLAFGKNIANNAPTNSSVDEFRIWTKAKSQEEIKADMYKTITSNLSDLAYNFTFDQLNNGTLLNSGNVAVSVPYLNAEIIPATTPVRKLEAPFNMVTGNWSVKNDNTNGIYFGDEISDFNSNLIIARESGDEVLPVLESSTTDTLYLAASWKMDPLFVSQGTIKADLTKIFDNLNQVELLAGEYFLLSGNPSAEIQIISTGSKEQNIVTFENVTFSDEPVYLAWKNIQEYPIGTFPITSGNLWKYNDTGLDLGTEWITNDYDDSSWAFGNAIFGYGDNVESTTLNYGGNSSDKYPTYYFRHIFNIEDASEYGNLVFNVMRDDGVVVYVNGTEAFRMNMPEGAINYNTYALNAVDGDNESAWFEAITENLLQDGENVIAVELHQVNATSSDTRFDMRVEALNPPLEVENYPIAKDRQWYYLDQGISLDAEDWTLSSYNVLNWGQGYAPFGYGDPVNTTISYGDNSGDKHITSYYVKDININLDEVADMVEFGLRRDDGAIVYINGEEVIRDNMLDGEVNFDTTAHLTVDGINENIYQIYRLPKSVFTEGLNRIAVEVHQIALTSSDTRFDMYIKDYVDLSIDCEEGHMGCFTSIAPTPMTPNLIISSDHRFQMIFKEGEQYISETEAGITTIPGMHDFTAYVSIDGSSENGYLSVNHENTPGGVSIVNVNFNDDTNLWEVSDSRAVDFYNEALVSTTRNCSGGLTPWGTVITAEETTNSGDSNGDGYQDVGWLVEIDPVTAKVMDYGNGQEKLWAMGRMNHENVMITEDGTTAYYGEDGATHLVYKYVMDTPGDLTAGTVYVFKADIPLSDRDPSSSTGTWVEVPNDTQADRNNMNQVASAVGGTSFNGVEDVEIGPDGKIYFTAKGFNRVYRFKDNGNTISEFETFVGGTSYSIETEQGTFTEPWGDGNDNLTFDDKGNLWVLQDGGLNYIWVVRPDHTQGTPNVVIHSSLPNGAEPTGLTFTPDYKFGFYSVQHPSGSNAPQQDASGNDVVFNASASVVFSTNDKLGMQAPTVDFQTDQTTIAPGETVTFTDLTSENPDSWFWTFEGGEPVTSTEQNPVVTYNTPGTYNVTLTAANALGDDTAVKTEYIIVEEEMGVVDLDSDKIKLYPNPTSGQVFVEFNSEAGQNVSIKVNDLSGRNLMNKQLSANGGTQKVELDLRQFVSADQVLLVKIQTGEQSQSFKILTKN